MSKVDFPLLSKVDIYFLQQFFFRWGRTLDSSGRTSIQDGALESSGDEDESSKVGANRSFPVYINHFIVLLHSSYCRGDLNGKVFKN